MVGRTATRACQQMYNALLEHTVGGKAVPVQATLGFHILYMK